ncbi:MAG TPA: excinuclease ABC subunit UvrA, partial [Candidatus Sumerlaeota bacterium]|nr:excinuclease ABC subunit UvrA [Candidatus Sumerlaeota bacterium]
MQDTIEIRGARTHNLKNINCTFPHGQFTVISGLSGSGKSSLAFDTLYAEGQRRFVESLSTYARQFIDRMERPDIDSITGIQPAIALEQKNAVRSARSTVGTATEVYDYIRLLYAKLGDLQCLDCGVPVRAETPDSVMRALADLPAGSRLTVLGPTDFIGERLNDSLRKELIRQGYHRLWDGYGLVDLEAGDSPRDPRAELAVITDRLVLRDTHLARLRTALETAFQVGRGRARVLARAPEAEADESFTFSAGLACNRCGRAYPTPEPQLFSFYSPLGACPACEGFGRVIELDLDKILPNRNLCIEDGAIAPWNSEGNLEMYDMLRAHTTPKQIPRLQPLSTFTDAQWRNLLDGCGEFPGIRGYFKWLESKRYKVQARVMLARYRAYVRCEACAGARLRPEALAFTFQGLNIAELNRLPVREVLALFEHLTLPPAEMEVAGRALETLLARLRYLEGIGLGYLTLDRQTRTLSGGESQRINLATALGSALTDTLYVLDEPTVGLHPRDTHRLIGILHTLRGLGNTVVVVEHDLDVIRSADRLIDMGPGAGERGGEILYEGPIAELNGQDTPTARHIRQYAEPSVPPLGRAPKGWITVRGARGHNLRNLTVRFPLGVFACVTGVSGSGKTTLVRDTLCAHYRRLREIAPVEAEPCDRIAGLDQIDSLQWVDQTPLAGSKRSNPVTYAKAYEWIRKTLAATREARALGVTARDLSFNVDGGRCTVCHGTGRQIIDMHFMADVEVVCEACDGRRFQERVLRLEWNGLNIHQILELTVDEATKFFREAPKIVRALKPLRDVGLGYLRLGQSTITLSGGEAQRLKLAAHLATMRDGERRMFVFDEPTTGLHPEDLQRLIEIFQQMVKRGCTLLVVEHNLD